MTIVPNEIFHSFADKDTPDAASIYSKLRMNSITTNKKKKQRKLTTTKFEEKTTEE